MRWLPTATSVPADGSGVTSEVALTRRGATAVVLVAYSLRHEPDRDALKAALAAVSTE